MKINELMQAPNVMFEEGAVEKFSIDGNTEIVAKDMLVSAVWELVQIKPSWKFIAKASRHYQNAVIIDKFRVMQDGEEIGALSSTFYRRKYCVALSGGKLDTYDAHRTKDISKVVGLAKKYFRKKDIADILAAAEEQSKQCIRSTGSNMQRVIHSCNEKLRPYLQSFALQNRREEFLESIKGYPVAEEAVAELDRVTPELEVATQMDMEYSAKKFITVISREGQYIVKFAEDTPNIYDDNNFPEEYRGKLGLLKLVSAGQMVSNVGVRVDTNIFVLLKEA